jgi:hypothetical protein
MKSIFQATLVVIALLLALNSNAQDKPLIFGVKAGLNLSNITGDIENNKAIIGFRAGVSVDYAFLQDLYLLTGLNYSKQGTKLGEIGGEPVKLNLSYLQLPVHIGYKLEVAEGSRLVFHAGPYAGYAVGGNWKVGSASIGAFSAEAESELGKLKRFDFGLGLGAGVEFGKFGVDLGWDFGLAKVNDSNGSTKNANAYLAVGYKF